MGLFNKLFGKNPDENENAGVEMIVTPTIFIEIYYNANLGFLIVPNALKGAVGISVSIEPVIVLDSRVSCEEIGIKLIAAFDISEKAGYIDNPKPWRETVGKAGGIKSFSKFSKIYRCVFAGRTETGYTFSEWMRDPESGGYIPSNEFIEYKLPLNADSDELGKTLLQCLNAKRELPVSDRREFATLDERVIEYKAPPDEYENIGDGNTDAYQIFEHENGNACFGFFFATKYDSMDGQGVKSLWTSYYGKLTDFEFDKENHALFQYTAGAKTSKSLIRSYFFLDDDCWSEFLLKIDTNGLAPERIDKIVEDYMRIVESCAVKQ
jgi:hypothetical protein